MTNQIRVHLLARAARAEQDDIDAGIAAQLRRLRAHIAERSWIITGETVEVGVGGNSMDRPGSKKVLVLAESEAPPFDILLVVSADRISRDIGTLSLLERRLREKGIAIHTLEGCGSSSPFTGQLWSYAIAAVHHRRWAERSQRMNSFEQRS